MKNKNLHWIPFFSLLRRELTRIYKVLVQTVLAPVINSFLYLLIFGISLGEHINLSLSHSYLSFLIPGLIMMGIMNNAFENASSSIVSLKFSGEMEYLASTPLGPHDIVWAMNLAGLTRGALVGLLTYLVGLVFLFVREKTIPGLAHPWALVFFVVIGSFSFAQLGLFSALISKSLDHLSIVSRLILLPLIYLGGVFFSLENLHPFWQSLAQFNPLLYLINGMRYAFLGESDVSLMRGLYISLLGFGLTYSLALWSLYKGGTTRRW